VLVALPVDTGAHGAEALKRPLATLDEPLSNSYGVACPFLTPYR